MIFKNREAQYPGRRRLIIVDSNNDDKGEPHILVQIVKDEGSITENGTPINAENLNKGNWRDDKSVSFRMLDPNTQLPNAQADDTQIVTDEHGKTWVIPPAGLGSAKAIGGAGGGVRRTGGNVTMNVTDPDKGKTIVFTSDVTGITITGSSILENNSSYDDTETRYIFKTGASSIPAPSVNHIDYFFPSEFEPFPDKVYMIALFGRVLTWSEGVQ